MMRNSRMIRVIVTIWRLWLLIVIRIMSGRLVWKYGIRTVVAAVVRGARQRRCPTPNVQELDSLLEDDAYYYDEESYTHSVGPKAVSPVDAGCSIRSSSSTGSSKLGTKISRSLSNSSIEIQPMIIDQTLSLFTSLSPRGNTQNNIDWSSTSANSTVIHQLQSISEADLPPPMNDTPHMSHRPESATAPPIPSSNAGCHTNEDGGAFDFVQ